MRASKADREKFVARLVSEIKADCQPEEVARWAGRIMRQGSTYARLQEAQCNGDWPADNGTYGDKAETCPRCEAVWHRSAMKRVPYMSEGKGGRTYYRRECPDCLCQDRIKRIASEIPGVGVVFQGDPRGCTVKLTLPSGYTNDISREGICVPTA